MKALDIIERLYETNPEIFGKVGKKKAASIVKGALKEIKNELAKIEVKKGN